MRTCIKKVRDQARVALLVKTKDDFDRLLKPQNLDIYYGHLHMECYYFC